MRNTGTETAATNQRTARGRRFVRGTGVVRDGVICYSTPQQGNRLTLGRAAHLLLSAARRGSLGYAIRAPRCTDTPNRVQFQRLSTPLSPAGEEGLVQYREPMAVFQNGCVSEGRCFSGSHASAKQPQQATAESSLPPHSSPHLRCVRDGHSQGAPQQRPPLAEIVPNTHATPPH
ncbi:unannotated protein [freshwater metagenome]|uniref:Unannotated protein n=1 Tax=freshwater metagenome TaxID=449393 RepID=A0A6J7R8A1_9ZZZZ